MLFVLQGELHQGVASMDIELAGDVRLVVLNRAPADEQFLTDLLARLVVG